MGQVGLGLIVGLILLSSDEVVVRMDKKTAQLNGYQITKTVYSPDPKRNGQLREMVYVKAPLTNIPFYKNNELDYYKFIKPITGEDFSRKAMPFVFVLMVIFIITAVSNAANLTDGIDGLAAGTSAIIAIALLIFAYSASNTIFADYLNILYVPESSELVIFAACLFAACIGFLWYNAFPAQVFMQLIKRLSSLASLDSS